jgi:CHAD domain-containing protein
LILEWIECGPWLEVQGGKAKQWRQRPIEAHAAKQLARLRRDLKAAAAPVAQLRVAERHRLRIRAKRMRYCIEFVATLYTKKKAVMRMKRSLHALRDMQRALGTLNDVAGWRSTATALLAEAGQPVRGMRSEGKVDVAVIVGVVEARQQRLIAAAEDARLRFLRQHPFWE